jgi:hypothetical protein
VATAPGVHGRTVERIRSGRSRPRRRTRNRLRRPSQSLARRVPWKEASATAMACPASTSILIDSPTTRPADQRSVRRGCFTTAA